MDLSQLRKLMTSEIAEIRKIDDVIDAQARAQEWALASGTYAEWFGALRRKSLAALVQEGHSHRSMAKRIGVTRQRVAQLLKEEVVVSEGTRPTNHPLVTMLDNLGALIGRLDDPWERFAAATKVIESLQQFQQSLRAVRTACSAHAYRAMKSYRQVGDAMDLHFTRVRVLAQSR